MLYNRRMKKKGNTSVRLTLEADALLKELARKLGISQTAIIEIAIRRLAEQEGIDRDTDANHPVSTE